MQSNQEKIAWMTDLHTSWHSWKNSRASGSDELQDVLQVVLAPIADEEADLEDVSKKIQKSLWKSASRFRKDPRVSGGGSQNAAGAYWNARAIIDEIVEWTMSALFNGPCWEKPWIAKVDFLPVLLVLVHQTLGDGPVFARTFGPTVLKAVEEAFMKWQEEDRVLKCFWEAMEPAGIPEKQRKKVYNSVMKSYDAAHYRAPFGADFQENATAESSPLTVLQDFVRGWMFQFLCMSSSELHAMQLITKEAKAAMLVNLFKTLADPTAFNCLPYELTSVLGQYGQEWNHSSFIEEAAVEVLDAYQAWLMLPPAKKRKKW